LGEVGRQEYLTVLTKLYDLGIRDPSTQEIATLFPHVPEEDRFALSSNYPRTHVALPPLTVGDVYHIARFYNQGGYLVWGHLGAQCLEASDLYVSYHDEAMEYAQEQWGESLVQEPVREVIQVHLEDPVNKRGSLLTSVKDVYFATSRSWEDMLEDGSEPLSRVIDKAIIKGTVFITEPYIISRGENGLMFEELTTDCCEREVYNCSNCGGGIKPKRCRGCRAEYISVGRDWKTPLPQKIVEVLEADGHVFKIKPVHARHDEKVLFQELRNM
jgi:hypothetical protein